MKINTLEKMEILILGLNAGRELEICVQSLKDGHLICGDIHDMGFQITEDGTVESWIHSIENERDRYTIEGCISEAKKAAKEYWKRKVIARRG